MQGFYWDDSRRAWLPKSGAMRLFGFWGPRVATIAVVMLWSFLAMAAITQIDLTVQVKGILPSANGGTGNGFTKFTGPGTSEKTFTLPNASATILTDNALVTIAQGGTGSAPAGDDQVLVSSSTTAGTWKTINDCTGAGKALTYVQATNSFGCNTIGSGSFADAETPTGTVNGSNVTFTLANTPSPAASLQLFKNGQLMIAGASADYTLSGLTITYSAGAKPLTGDVHVASYRF